MSQPIVADNKPVAVDLKKGETYYFCTCGRSQNQPFCDGAHAGTAFKPQPFTAEADEKAYLCACKYSSNLPFCDGSHAQFDDDQIGQAVPEPEPDLKPDQEPNLEPVARVKPTAEEPHIALIHEMAKNGLASLGEHGPVAAMGVPREQLPKWDDIQIMVAQLAKKPLMEDVAVASELVIGPKADKPLRLSMPLFVSDMSFGALSEEAKLALAKGAELAGTGICSGEGGMLPEEQAANSRYFYELASAQFGYDESLMAQVQAFHFKGGQGAKTGTGGHLPGAKVTAKIAQVRGIEAGQAAISPPTFKDLHSVDDFRPFADRVRELSGGIPIGFKLSANHIEQDIDFALQASADYIILDGRGGGTGAAPLLFRDHISVPTIPALARARKHLDDRGVGRDVSLIITGGLRTPSDFIKAMALGADGVALANSAMQAIGCVGARICHSNQCPAGIATQKAELRARLDIEKSAAQLNNFLRASVQLMQVMARACGHDRLDQFARDDLATFNADLAKLARVPYAGLGAP